MLGAIWEVVKNSGGEASLEEAGQGVKPLKIKPGPWSLSHFLLPVHHETSSFFLHVLLLPSCCASMQAQNEQTKNCGLKSLKL
jgi:hypothetical protein